MLELKAMSKYVDMKADEQTAEERREAGQLIRVRPHTDWVLLKALPPCKTPGGGGQTRD
jgi:hypothetical protein